MTKSQQKTLEKLKAAIFHHDGFGDIGRGHEYEFKAWKVTESTSSSKLVFVLSVVGRKGDEGSMAAFFGRTRRHISIGPRGGITLLNPKGVSKDLYKHKTRPQGFWAAIHEVTE